jgi:hypothetical protein
MVGPPTLASPGARTAPATRSRDASSLAGLFGEFSAPYAPAATPDPMVAGPVPLDRVARNIPDVAGRIAAEASDGRYRALDDGGFLALARQIYGEVGYTHAMHPNFVKQLGDILALPDETRRAERLNDLIRAMMPSENIARYTR